MEKKDTARNALLASTALVLIAQSGSSALREPVAAIQSQLTVDGEHQATPAASIVAVTGRPNNQEADSEPVQDGKGIMTDAIRRRHDDITYRHWRDHGYY